MASRDKSRTRGENAKPTGPDVWSSWQGVIAEHIRWLRDDYWNGWRSWRAALFLARAKQWSEQVKASDSLQFASDLVDDAATVPLIATHIENMIGFLTQSDPQFVATPRREQDVDPAEIQEALLNYRWRELEMDDQYAMALRDFCTIGHCVIGTGFAFEDDVKRMRPKGALAGSTTNYDDNFRAGSPYLRRVNPFAFLKDRYAPDGTLATARWCAEILFRPIDDIVQDSNYDDKVRRSIRNREGDFQLKTLRTWYAENEWLAPRGTEEQGSEDIGVLVKLYDKRYRVFRVLGLGVDQPLLEDDWPFPYLDGFPYVMRDFVHLPNEPYGVGFTHFAAHMQLLENRLSTKMAEHARKHNAKYIAKGWGDDDDQLDEFEKDEHGTLLRGTGQNPTIEPVERPQFGEDLFRIHAIVESNMRRLMMEDQIASGPMPGRTSATEIRTRNQLFGAKLRDVVRSSEKLLRDSARQILQHIKANADVGETVRVVGRKGVTFVELSEADVAAEIDIDVTAVAREQVDPVTRRQQALDLLQRTAAILPQIFQVQAIQAQAGLPVQPIAVDFNALFRAVIKTFDDRELERAFPNQAVEAQQLPPQIFAPPAAPGTGGPSPQDPTQSAQQSALPQPGR